MSGSVILKNTCAGFAPRLAAASSTDQLKFTSMLTVFRIMYGKMMTICPISILIKGVNILIDAVVLISTKANEIDGMNIGLVKKAMRSPLPLKSYFVTQSEANTPMKISKAVATTATFILFTKPVGKSV